MKESPIQENTESLSTLRTKILISFFLILSFAGIAINLIFINMIQSTLYREGLSSVLIQNITRQFTIVGTGITLVGILVVLFVALVFSEAVTRPLRALTAGMLELAGGKTDTQITIDSNDEIGQLADGFNHMAHSIKESMEQTGAAKQFTENIVKSVPSILIVLSENMKLLTCNEAFDRLAQQYPSLEVTDIINSLKKSIDLNLSTGELCKDEVTLTPKDTDVHLIFSAAVSTLGTNHSYYDGENPRVLLTLTDITERKKMKELVLQSKQDWEDTFNTIPDMITIHDKDFNIIQANEAAQRVLNLPFLAPDRINKCFRYYHGTDRAPEGCPSCDCMQTGEAATFEVYEPYLKRFIEIRSIPRRRNDGEMIGLIHIVRDITERKKIEEEHNKLLAAITKAKIEWEAVFDTVSEFIVLIDKDFRIRRCNSSFARYAQSSPRELVGARFQEILLTEQEVFRNCETLVRKEEVMTRTEMKCGNGHWFYVSHKPIRDRDGNYLHTIFIVTDITGLKNTQQQLKQSENTLKKQVEDLEKFYDMAIGRELRMKELKKEIKRLNAELVQYDGNGSH